MRILILHPEDSPRRGPWTAQKWDRIVDLGKSSESTGAAWQELTGSAVIRLNDFRRSIEDPRQAGQILRQGFGSLVDRDGVDWWEVTGLFVHSTLETAIALGRLAKDASLEGALYATRPDWPVSGVAQVLGRQIQSFSSGAKAGPGRRVLGMARTLRRLSRSQIVEIAWDKYDANYRWRARLARARKPSARPVVLLPSAYTNVSRVASAFARQLPEQDFLLVATRESGLRFECPPNVQTARLEEFAGAGREENEFADLNTLWIQLVQRLSDIPEMAMLHATGALEPIPMLIRSGLAVRDAWSRVLDRVPVRAVLCGDDSNWYTRLPVLLASKRKLPTVDFHHGAFDGRYLLKRLSSDIYLAKNEMERDYLLRICGLPAERVVVSSADAVQPAERSQGRREKIVFFSEPYESVGGRPEEVYRELLPALSKVASQYKRRLVVKLHPFENLGERSRLVTSAVGAGWRDHIEIVSGPTTSGLLDTAWFGITVESSTVVDCVRHGVPCFHCAWLVSTPFGYSEQYARFGVGHLLHSLNQVHEIPQMLADASRFTAPAALGSPAIADVLRQLLTRSESLVVSQSRGVERKDLRVY